jgi:hypothetical protein
MPRKGAEKPKALMEPPKRARVPLHEEKNQARHLRQQILLSASTRARVNGIIEYKCRKCRRAQFSASFSIASLPTVF